MSSKNPLQNRLIESAREARKKYDVLVNSYPNTSSILQLLPGLFWVLFFLGGATLLIVLYSILQNPPPSGGLNFTIQNYVEFIRTTFYWDILWESFIIAIQVTVFSLFIGYIPAYYISFNDSRWKNALLLLMILPFWVNLVVRTYAWQLILGQQGLINYVLSDVLNLLTQPSGYLFSQQSIIIGLVHVFLPFTVVPIYTSIDRVERSQIEVAKNLGANRFRAFYEVTFPQTLPGVGASAVLVFVLSFGSFIVPSLLGGQSNIMIANVISDLFVNIGDWGLGSAVATVFVITVLVLVYLFNRTLGLEELYSETKEEET